MTSGADLFRLGDGRSGEGVGSSGMSVNATADDDRQSALTESSFGDVLMLDVSYPSDRCAASNSSKDVNAVVSLRKESNSPSVQDRSSRSCIFCSRGQRNS